MEFNKPINIKTRLILEKYGYKYRPDLDGWIEVDNECCLIHEDLIQELENL